MLSQDQLYNLFKFDSTDLQQNRSGSLTVIQKNRLKAQKRNDNILVIVLGLGFIGTGIFFFVVQKSIFSGILLTVFGLLPLYAGYISSKIDLDNLSIEQVSGAIKTIEKVSSGADHVSNHSRTYLLVVEGIRITLTMQQYDALSDGEEYTIHYTYLRSNSGGDLHATLLSLELGIQS